LTDARFIQSLASGVEDIREMNLQMQTFFREWYEADPNVDADAAFVDQSNIEIMTRLNKELTDKLNDSELKDRFRQNVILIRDLMNEIISRVKISQPNITSKIKPEPVLHPRLDPVFETLNV
ncbi:MAG: hypothetical protein AAF939_15390, partial [Planctomycetota bacterium]